ncbi:MAG: MFS transporter [Nocardioides sp.]|uniref:MFS transporter n=1 Tax=Nocardioides sp. TaxID=35761 RepID=UPI003F0E1C91
MTGTSGTRRAPLRGMLASDTISMLGNRLSLVALPWFVLTTTGSATQTGLVAAAQVAPQVIAKAASGPVLDRLGARRIAVACDLANLPVLAAIPLAHAAGLLTFPLLLVLVAVSGALSGPADAAKGVLVPEVSRLAGVSLERATGLNGALERTASMAGIGLAGIVVTAVGAGNALYVNALTFGLAGVVLAATTAGTGRPAQETSSGSYLGDLAEGWHFLRRDPVLVSICAMVAVTNLVDQAWSAVLLPVWTKESGAGVGTVSLVLTVMTGSAILGALAAATLAERLPRFATYVVAFLLAGAPRFLVLALDAPLWAVLVVHAVAGAASGFLNPILSAVILERIPTPLLGRVSALNTALCWSLMPFGGLLAGLGIAAWGVAPALLAGGAVYLVATMAPTVVPSFRAFDRRADLTPEEPPPAPPR